MTDKSRLQVLLEPEMARVLERHCQLHGYKKSTLAAKLIREYLERQGEIGPEQQPLFSAKETERAS